MYQYVVKGKIKRETIFHDTYELFHFLPYPKNNWDVCPALTLLLLLLMTFIFRLSCLRQQTLVKKTWIFLLQEYMIITNIERIRMQNDLEEIVFHWWKLNLLEKSLTCKLWAQLNQTTLLFRRNIYIVRHHTKPYNKNCLKVRQLC